MLWSRSVLRLRVAPMPVEGLVEEKVRGVGSIVAEAVSGTSAQGCNSAKDGGTVTGVGGRDSGHARCAAWWPDVV